MISQAERKSNVKILVTGGSGFVGRNIVKRLVDDGHEVTMTSSGIEPHTPGVKKILYRGLEGIDWTKIYGQDVVVHQAANNDTRCQDESEIYRANVYGPIKLFVEAAKGGCKKFVYASSTAVYGAEPAPYVEGVTQVKPLNKYGESKAKFDEFAMQFAKDYNVSVVGFRYCNVYGPGEDHKGKRMSMIGQLMRTMLKDKQPALFEFGEQRRDWIYVDDVVEANVCAIRAADAGHVHDIYNMGSGVATSFNDVVNEINIILLMNGNLAFPLEPKYVPCPFASEYQSFTQCEMKKARDELGFVPRHSLRSGVEEYFEHLIDAA
jgi:ADP-L-glycero-D-manno-heptose 6-epimerase